MPAEVDGNAAEVLALPETRGHTFASVVEVLHGTAGVVPAQVASHHATAIEVFALQGPMSMIDAAAVEMLWEDFTFTGNVDAAAIEVLYGPSGVVPPATARIDGIAIELMGGAPTVAHNFAAAVEAMYIDGLVITRHVDAAVIEVLYEGPPPFSDIEPNPIPDNGGVELTLIGVFDTAVGYTVTITDNADISRECFSGVLGQGNLCFSEDGTTLKCWAPPLPLTAGADPYDVIAVPEAGITLVATQILEVIHRTFPSTVFGLRSTAARPRNVGPYSIEDED